jgi:hypothetical protein
MHRADDARSEPSGPRVAVPAVRQKRALIAHPAACMGHGMRASFFGQAWERRSRRPCGNGGDAAFSGEEC